MPTEPALPEEDYTRSGRRLIFASACMSMLVFAMAGQILPASLASISEDFQRDFAERGLLLALVPLGFVVSTLLSDYLSDRLGQRVFIVGGLLLLAGGLALMTWAHGYHLLQVGLFLVGASGGFVESPISVVVARVFATRRAQALNALQIFFNVGAILGPVAVGGILSMGWGWRCGFGLVIPVALSALGLSCWALPADAHEHSPDVDRHARTEGGWGLVMILALAQFLYVAGEMTVVQWGANYVHDVLGAARNRAALVVSGFWFGMMLSRALYVVIVGRMGYLRPVMGSALLACLAALAAAAASSGLVAGLLCCLVGFCLAGTWATILGYAAHRSPARTGAVFGIIVSAGALGGVAGPPLAGWVATISAHGLRATMVVGAAAILAEGLVVLGVWLADRRA